MCRVCGAATHAIDGLMQATLAENISDCIAFIKRIMGRVCDVSHARCWDGGYGYRGRAMPTHIL